MREIPVLLYHNIGNYPEEMMEDGILPQTFERQMKFFSENAFEIVALEKAMDHLNKKIRLNSSTLSITIDGGYRDGFTHVLPVLKQYDFKATFFIAPEYINRERHIKGGPIQCLSWDEVREIARSGMEIGLLANRAMSIKVKYDEAAIKESVIAAINILNKEIDYPIRYCAFKEGVPGKGLWEFLQARGLQAVFTQCPTNRKAANDGIGRIQIDDDDHNIFLTKISKTYLYFKDKRTWKYIRKYKVDRLAHRISDGVNWIKGENS